MKLAHPGMVASASANAVDLRNALLDMLKTKEVVLFNGHASVSGRLLPADFQSASVGNEGNVCAKKATGTGKACASVCMDDAGCPSAYKCQTLAAGGTISGKACVAR